MDDDKDIRTTVFKLQDLALQAAVRTCMDCGITFHGPAAIVLHQMEVLDMLYDENQVRLLHTDGDGELKCAGHLHFTDVGFILQVHQTPAAGLIQGAFLTALMLHKELTQTSENENAKNVH